MFTPAYGRCRDSAGRLFPAIVAGVCLLAGNACSTHSTQSNVILPSNDPTYDRKLLDASEQKQVLAIMRRTTEDASSDTLPSPRLHSAPRGMRFSDVPKAVAVTCLQPKIQMVIVDTLPSKRDIPCADVITFILRTSDDRHVELVVERVDGTEVYSAVVSVGRFNNDPRRGDALLRELNNQMLRLGRRISLRDD